MSYTTLTNRQLLSDYRTLKRLELDLVARKSEGWTCYLGESLNLQLHNVKSDIKSAEVELRTRGYSLTKILY